MTRRRAFTLIELVVALAVTGLIVVAVATAISQTLRARTLSESRQQARSRAQAAAMLVARDAACVVRDGDLYYAMVLVSDGGTPDRPADHLLLFTTSLRPVRPESIQNEGPMREVQYRIEATPAPPAAPGARPAPAPSATLWRRIDPIPDEVVEGGGVASPVVEGIESFSVEAFDGESWYPAWDSDLEGYPHALRIVVTAVSDDGRSRSVARRAVAIDRVPLPYATADSAVAQEGTAP